MSTSFPESLRINFPPWVHRRIGREMLYVCFKRLVVILRFFQSVWIVWGVLLLITTFHGEEAKNSLREPFPGDLLLGRSKQFPKLRFWWVIVTILYQLICATFMASKTCPIRRWKEPVTTPHSRHGVLTDRSIFSLNLSRTQIPTGTSVTNCNHKQGVKLTCRYDVDMCEAALFYPY